MSWYPESTRVSADRHSSPSNTVELPLYSQDILYVINAIETFDRLREGKMTVFVSHRLSSATVASKIVVLEGGHVVEEGTHCSLMELGGKY